MSKGTLDQFFGGPAATPVSVATPVSTQVLFTDEKCCKCGINLHGQDQYKLTKKGKEELYCRGCFKKKMRPLEESEASL